MMKVLSATRTNEDDSNEERESKVNDGVVWWAAQILSLSSLAARSAGAWCDAGDLGRRMDLDPLRQTRADRRRQNTNLLRRSAKVTERRWLVLSAVLVASCFKAIVMRGPIPPELDITMGVKLPQSTLLMRSSYSSDLVVSNRSQHSSGVMWE